jgi:metallophosphoesterase (TIGR00282 family)
LKKNSKKINIAVINLIGRVFMVPVDCPFKSADREIEKINGNAKIIFVDIHAEATSEKQAMGYYLDGRVTGVFGTHTHVMTADEKILPKGTAYITDAGMTGPFDSVIGVKKEIIIRRFLMAAPEKFELSETDVHINAVLTGVDEADGRAKTIERIDIKYE